MKATQKLITGEVRRYMDALALSQSALADILGCSQTNVSARLRGATRWSIEDLEALEAAGCPIGVRVLYMGEAVGA